MSIKLITHKGETRTVSDWARHCGANKACFGSWVRDYGIATAIDFAKMSDRERRSWRKAQKENNGVNAWDAELPEPDKDAGWRNRVAGWLRMGMSVEEMKIKARMYEFEGDM